MVQSTQLYNSANATMHSILCHASVDALEDILVLPKLYFDNQLYCTFVLRKARLIDPVTLLPELWLMQYIHMSTTYCATRIVAGMGISIASTLYIVQYSTYVYCNCNKFSVILNAVLPHMNCNLSSITGHHNKCALILMRFMSKKPALWTALYRAQTS